MLGKSLYRENLQDCLLIDFYEYERSSINHSIIQLIY